MEEIIKPKRRGRGKAKPKGILEPHKENWTKEKCHQEALLFTKRRDFSRCSNAYAVAKKNGWLNEICFHMVRERIQVIGYKKNKRKGV